ncbi:hypothetical protein CORC01_10162 [Colletotrichum orchidophilum]|uniref:Peroxin 20 n=1 Tax=Colletotrichum orchidophilum TaxID=1209926 RepID=A0A1G4AZD6_9PEZI|nr:uncharacterized protein CORC01_10162 [Colletotrichum orchidophilum]OHE94529.1 hypothetical protein CORC01_10162 [Colletotrichum orchidophilum]
MADSSCSGSAPFKSLVDHGVQDRSLHRDRFSSAPSLQQGFRSTNQPYLAPAQAGFGEFRDSIVNAQIVPNIPQTYDLSTSNFSLGLQMSHAPAALDSRLLPPNPYQSASQIPSTAARATSQPKGSITSPPRASSWAQDFAAISKASPGAGIYAPGYSSSQYPAPAAGFTHDIMGSQSRPWLFGPQGSSSPVRNHGLKSNEADFDLEMNRWMAAHGDGRMEDLDAIMEQLAMELEQEQQTRAATQSPTDALDGCADTATTSASHISVQDGAQRTEGVAATAAITQQVSGSLSGHEIDAISVATRASLSDHVLDLERLRLDEANEGTPEPAEQGQSFSDISEAARQILESVQHEQGDKWKNSRFLSLMKDFRDGNKDIINNEILETSVNDEQIVEN